MGICLLVLTLLLCASCRNSGKTAGAVLSSPPVFTMLYSDNASYGYDPDWLVLGEMTRLTGVRLEIEAVPESDYLAKRKLVFSSGDFPDIVAKTNASEVSALVDVNLLLPVNKYMDRLPFFSSFVEEYQLQSELDSMTEGDGNFYGLPVKCFTERVQNQIWTYRSDVLEIHGLPVPESYDELFRVSKSLKELYPDSYPLTNRFGQGNLLASVAPSFGIKAGWELGNSGYTYREDQGRWVFAPVTQEYKNALLWLNRMLEEGLLDPEFATLDSNIYEKRIETGKTFFMADWLGNEIRYHKNGREEDPGFTVSPMLPPAGPEGLRAVRGTRHGIQGWVFPARVTHEEDFERFLSFVDWFYSDEGTNLFAWGVEGVTYTVDDKGGKQYVSEFDTGEWDPSRDFGFLNNCLTVVYPFDAFLARQSEESQAVLRQMAEQNMVPNLDPKLRPSGDERRKIRELEAGLSDYYNRMTLKFIYGEESFENWDEYVLQCELRGSDKLGTLFNKIWEREKVR